VNDKAPNVQVERCAALMLAEKEAVYRRIRSNAGLGASWGPPVPEVSCFMRKLRISFIEPPVNPRKMEPSVHVQTNHIRRGSL